MISDLYYIVISVGYITFDLGLFNNTVCLGSVSESKNNASKLLIGYLQKLMHDHTIELKNLSFIGVCVGPGPFTSARVASVTANGLAFATKVPLVEINSFEALLYQHDSNTNIYRLLVYNAYSADIYYALAYRNNYKQGCVKKENLILIIKQFAPLNARIICGGQMIKNLSEFLLENLVNYNLVIDSDITEPSIDQLAAQAFENYKQDKTTYHAQPLYLKEPTIN